MKSIFYSKGYYEEVEVLRKLEKNQTIGPDEQSKIKEYHKNLHSILMSYEELYDKIIAMENHLIARKEKITGITEKQKQDEVYLKEKELLEKGTTDKAQADTTSVPAPANAKSTSQNSPVASTTSQNTAIQNPLVASTSPVESTFQNNSKPNSPPNV
jgi:hypothetical protein